MTAAVEWAEYAARDFEVVKPPAWRDLARPEQLPPDGAWLVWAFIAGRGAGKTRSAAEWVHERALTEPGCRIALVGRTPADVRDVMIEGESGILAVARDDDKPVYQSTKRRLTWPNGSTAHAYSAEVPAQLRGPQHHYAWCDEPASWTDARKGDVLDTAWNNLMLGLRLGESPRCVATTTPKPVALIRTLLGRASTVVTRGSTYDNLANLAPSFRDEVLAAYEGTRIGRQELLGELLEDVEGALWTLALIDEDRVTEVPDMRRIVVGVDPSGGDGAGNDEQGIVVVGLGVDGDLYVLADRSCKLSPHGWASRAIGALHEFEGDRIIAEKNYGGAMVLSTIQQVSAEAPVKVITASRGKVQRAEPVAAAYEKHRVHHVAAPAEPGATVKPGALAKLEDQMTTWTPHDGTSPDRLDALVWAVTELTDNFGGDAWIAWAKRKAEEAEAERDGAAPPGPRPSPAAEAVAALAAGPDAEPAWKPCDKPDCDHLVSPGAAYCCGACATAAEGRYEILAHDPGCDERAAERARPAPAPEPPPGPVDHAAARKAARDAAFRAQRGNW